MKITHSLYTVVRVCIVASLLAGCSSSPLGKQLGDPSHSNRTEMQKRPYVVLVSIDGYRYDYTDLYSPPTLKKLRDQGASAKSLIPVFPSKTFTNHYSIATGLYAENHGIVGNKFYDSVRKEEYKLSDRKQVQDGTWYGGTPLWVAAERQGMLAANFFWPGSEAAIQGIRPSYYYIYDAKISLSDRVTQVRKWLELPEEKRPHLITVYFSEVDSAGHHFGPNSKELKEAVARVDGAMAELVTQLDSLAMPINLVVVSDHGMQELDPNKTEYLDDYTDLKGAKLMGDGPQVLIYVEKAENLEKIYKDLKSKGKHYRVYKRNEIPAELHYSKSNRVGDLMVVADAPYSVGVHDPKMKVEPGNHGYDPDRTQTMHGIFYAQGSHIRKGISLPSFRNVHIYPWILKILGLNVMEPIDGKPEVLEKIYQNRPSGASSQFVTGP